MKILVWGIRLALFLIFLVFAVQNTGAVSLRLLAGQVWQAPLVLVLLLFFAAGALLGISSLLGLVFRQRREISRLKAQAPSATDRQGA